MCRLKLAMADVKTKCLCIVEVIIVRTRPHPTLEGPDNDMHDDSKKDDRSENR